MSLYTWLADETSPKMLVEMKKIFGTIEAPGTADNPTILAWAREVGLENVYRHDSIAWCGLAMAVVARRAGKVVPHDPLWALNWRNFGMPVDRPMLGDVMVKSRAGGGHVTLYIGEDGTNYHCMGGNQSDQINITRIPMRGIDWAFRRPLYRQQPANVRIVKVAAGVVPVGGSEA